MAWQHQIAPVKEEESINAEGYMAEMKIIENVKRRLKISKKEKKKKRRENEEKRRRESGMKMKARKEASWFILWHYPSNGYVS